MILLMQCLERSFLHFKGIGSRTESQLWDAGIDSWARLESLLRQGVTPARLRQGSPPRAATPGKPGKLARRWLTECNHSETALKRGDLGFFLDRLPAGEHWRVLSETLADALFLDIETTGLSLHHHYVTVIGALFRGEFHQWVWPERTVGLSRLIAKAPLIVTFNGRRFDVPFLRRHFARLPEPRAHVDLLYLGNALGLSGGQKALEDHFRVRRSRAVKDIDGAQAVNLWSDAMYGSAASFRQLLEYNRADVENLPRLAASLCSKLQRESLHRGLRIARPPRKSELGHTPAPFSTARRAWQRRRITLRALLRNGNPRMTDPVVGVDLRGNPANPTGVAVCAPDAVETRVVRTDEEILDVAKASGARLVSIDAPLALPRGRKSPFDNSPCRPAGIVRDAERALWSRGIPVYPALIKHMQRLTMRGIELAAELRREGIDVIESYPGAAQDILGIPRKKSDLELLRRGLGEFGFRLTGTETHDELDAVTSAMVGYFFLAEEYEAVGAEDECFLIIPRATQRHSWRQ